MAGEWGEILPDAGGQVPLAETLGLGDEQPLGVYTGPTGTGLSSGKIFPVPATHSHRANHRPRTLQGTLAPTKGARRCALLPGLPAPDAPAGSRLPTHWPLPTPDEPLGTVTRQWGLRTDSLTSPSSMGWGPRGRSGQLRFRDLQKKGKGTPAIPPAQCKYLSPLCRASPGFLALSNFPTSPWVEGIIPGAQNT